MTGAWAQAIMSACLGFNMTAGNRLLVLGDSLTFGRPKYQVYYDDTWPGLLQASGFNVFHRGRGGADILSVLSEAKSLEGYMAPAIPNSHKPFDYCIVQVGIVDLTPRIFSRKFISLSRFAPGSGWIISRLNRNRKLIELIGSSWVKPREFEAAAKQLAECCRRLADQVYFIEIARPAHNLIRNCGDFSIIVQKYNNLLREVADSSYLSIFGAQNPELYLLPDGHHLSVEGHNLVAARFLSTINTSSKKTFLS